MDLKRRLRNKLGRRVLVLDGATGTELQARGMPAGVSPELYCIEHPEVIGSVHRGYVEAGSNVIYTCTFGANRHKLGAYGCADVTEVNRRLARAALEAAGGRCLVAGDIGPTGRLVEPFGDLGFEDAVSCFKEQVKGLVEGGVDLFVIETMMDIQEARAALIAVKETTDRFTAVSLTYDSTGRTFTGVDCVAALITLQSLGADAVGCNCSTGPEEMKGLISKMRPCAKVPLMAKPNAGLPRLEGGKTFFDMAPVEFARHARALVDAGAAIVGGCCGTTPAHIRALKEQVKAVKPPSRTPSRVSALSSHAASVILERQGELVVIGERINPTGKKALQEELKEGVFTLVRKYARDQAAKGARVLDVNVGMPGIDEAAVLREAVKQVVLASDAPLCIDTTRPDALEAALRVYPGRALVNSISGEEAYLDRRLGIASCYGAMFILLPMTGTSLPRTVDERRRVAAGVMRRAAGYGLKKEDMVVDALTMAVSADPMAAVETLNTIRWCSRVLGCSSVVGLSNVSFGLPERRWINAAFLAMAGALGLSSAIANPESQEVMNVKYALDVLRGADRNARQYISRFGPGGPPPAERPEDLGGTPGSRIARAVIEGERDAIAAIVEDALDKGADPRALVDEVMIPAIREVGELYERRVYFLPQLIASAEAMKRGIERLEPVLESQGPALSKGTVVLATVRGDIHDIGKNIVGLMLRNNGFSVEDLGKDVPAEDIALRAREKGAHIVALSALMTTTMASMEETVRHLRGEGLVCEVMVGGAVVTRGFAEEIGASYAKDGVEAVRVAEGLMSRIKARG